MFSRTRAKQGTVEGLKNWGHTSTNRLSFPVSVIRALKTFSFKKPWITTPPDFQTFLWPCTIVVSYVCFCWCSKQLQWPLVITVYQNIHSLSMTILSRKTLYDFRTCTKQQSMTLLLAQTFKLKVGRFSKICNRYIRKTNCQNCRNFKFIACFTPELECRMSKGPIIFDPSFQICLRLFNANITFATKVIKCKAFLYWFYMVGRFFQKKWF